MERTPQFRLSEEEELESAADHAVLSPGSNSSHRPQVGAAAAACRHQPPPAACPPAAFAAGRLLPRSLNLPTTFNHRTPPCRLCSIWISTTATMTRCWTGSSMQVTPPAAAVEGGSVPLAVASKLVEMHACMHACVRGSTCVPAAILNTAAGMKRVRCCGLDCSSLARRVRPPQWW